jgi:hypothetical protein
VTKGIASVGQLTVWPSRVDKSIHQGHGRRKEGASESLSGNRAIRRSSASQTGGRRRSMRLKAPRTKALRRRPGRRTAANLLTPGMGARRFRWPRRRGLFRRGLCARSLFGRGSSGGLPGDTDQARTNQVDDAIPKIGDRNVALSGGDRSLDISDVLLGGCGGGPRSGAVGEAQRSVPSLRGGASR